MSWSLKAQLLIAVVAEVLRVWARSRSNPARRRQIRPAHRGGSLHHV